MNRPIPITPISIENFPEDLTKKNQWIIWHLTEDGKKPPLNPASGRHLDITRPSAGTSLDQAQAALQRFEHAQGLGFIFKGDGMVGIDLDDCVRDGKADPQALDLLHGIGCQYVEHSPSGSGLHGIGLAEEIFPATVTKLNGLKVEIYCRDRYFTMTGRLYEDYAPNGQITLMGGLPELVDKLRSQSPTQVTEEAQVTHDTYETQETNARGSTAFTSDLAKGNRWNFPSICVPSGIGWRNRAVFQLARYLKQVIPDSSEDELYDVVGIWFQTYRDRMRTQDFEITWVDFRYAWDQVHSPYGATLEAILEKPAPIPDWMRSDRIGKRGTELLSVCATLAGHHSPLPFFLSARTAAFLTGMDHSDCAKLLKVFTLDGYLVVVDPGNRRKARSYLLGRDPHLTQRHKPL